MPKSPQKAAPEPAAAKAPVKGDHVFLVDGSSYIFRAYHALPPLSRKSDGLQVNAVLGFCNMLWKLLREMPPDNRPTHLAIIFDKSEVTFRNKLYPDYKAHRPPAPDDLIPQFGLIREAVRAFDLPCLEQAGFEADDLIATYAREAGERGATATIVSSDKDLMQLVTDKVVMYDTMKDRRPAPAPRPLSRAARRISRSPRVCRCGDPSSCRTSRPCRSRAASNPCRTTRWSRWRRVRRPPAHRSRSDR